MKKRLTKTVWRYSNLILIVLIFLIAGLITYQLEQTKISQSIPSPSKSAPLYYDFRLIIPSLSVNAPIIPDVDGGNQLIYDQALENGVAQLKGSAKPGEGSNVFIFGHSSFYWWNQGHYKEVFRYLDDLKIGDEFSIWYNSQEYKYQVSSKKTVWPSQVEVILPTKEEQVSLMTCVPPGTTLKRLIVVAKRTN